MIHWCLKQRVASVIDKRAPMKYPPARIVRRAPDAMKSKETGNANIPRQCQLRIRNNWFEAESSIE